MNCPTCLYTTRRISAATIHGDYTADYCPRCGTLVEDGGPEDPRPPLVTVPALVGRCRTFERDAAAHPDCSEVTVVVNLDRRVTTTSYTKRGRETTKAKPLISLREATVLRRIIEERVKRLKGMTDQAAGSLYPAIWAGEIAELEELFERLTTYPLGTHEE